jgi:cytidylate kinase
MTNITITIDGPSGSGKGTTAKRLAERLWFQCLDTGAMYRALAVYISGKCRDILDIKPEELQWIDITFNWDNRVCINGEDYEDRIRTPWAAVWASQIASQGCVRELVIWCGKKIIHEGNFVIEGRDTGTVWAPDAAVKIFLTADPAVRANRRYLELMANWEEITEAEVLAQIHERDQKDRTRSDGPLRKPEGAHEIDTTHLEIGEQVEEIYEIVQEVLQI